MFVINNIYNISIDTLFVFTLNMLFLNKSVNK